VSVFLLSNFVANLWVTPHVHTSSRGYVGSTVGGFITEDVLPACTVTVYNLRHGPLPTAYVHCLPVSPACDRQSPPLRHVGGFLTSIVHLREVRLLLYRLREVARLLLLCSPISFVIELDVYRASLYAPRTAVSLKPTRRQFSENVSTEFCDRRVVVRYSGRHRRPHYSGRPNDDIDDTARQPRGTLSGRQPSTSGRVPTGRPEADETYRAIRQPYRLLRRQTERSNEPASLPTPSSVRLPRVLKPSQPLCSLRSAFGDTFTLLCSFPFCLDPFSYSPLVSLPYRRIPRLC